MTRQTGMRRGCRFCVRFRKLLLKRGNENTRRAEHPELSNAQRGPGYGRGPSIGRTTVTRAGGRPHTRTQGEPQMDGWHRVCSPAGMRVLA